MPHLIFRKVRSGHKTGEVSSEGPRSTTGQCDAITGTTNSMQRCVRPKEHDGDHVFPDNSRGKS